MLEGLVGVRVSLAMQRGVMINGVGTVLCRFWGSVESGSSPILCPCPFLPAAPPKAAESEEETPETPQKNSNKKGKGKKSKKVQNPPQSCGGPLGVRAAALPPQCGSGG